MQFITTRHQCKSFSTFWMDITAVEMLYLFLKEEIKVECIQYFFHQYRNLRAFVSSTHLPDSSARGSLCHDVLVDREDRQTSQI